MANGYLRPLDTAMLTTLGEWIDIMKEATVGTKPTGIEVDGEEGDFIMKGEGAYYLFCHNLLQRGSVNVIKNTEGGLRYEDRFKLTERIKSVRWLVGGGALDFTQNGDDVLVNTEPRPYGESTVIRIAKIEI